MTAPRDLISGYADLDATSIAENRKFFLGSPAAPTLGDHARRIVACDSNAAKCEQRAEYTAAAKWREKATEARREAEALVAARRRDTSRADNDARELLTAANFDLKPGAVLEHRRLGRVLATCRYEGPRQWVYEGRVYESAYLAAHAAASALGKYSRPSPWRFWGLEKSDGGL